MRALLLAMAALLVAGCGTAPAPVERPKADAAKEEWYGQAVEQLAGMNGEAEGLLKSGKADEAGAIVTRGLALEVRLLAAPRPTLAAMEAASDLDQLYGRMLLNSRQYGWARLQFQKNLVRWKHWQPQTAETARRVKMAEAAIAECDRRIGE